MSQTWCVHTIGYYLTTEKKEVLMYTLWRHPENMPSQRSRTQTGHILESIFYEISRTGKSVETETRLVVAEGMRGEGDRGTGK